MRLDRPMGDEMSFKDLVHSLEGAGLTGEPQDAFQISADADFFVDPELLIKEDLGDLSSDVILISARGQVAGSPLVR